MAPGILLKEIIKEIIKEIM